MSDKFRFLNVAELTNIELSVTEFRHQMRSGDLSAYLSLNRLLNSIVLCSWCYFVQIQPSSQKFNSCVTNGRTASKNGAPFRKRMRPSCNHQWRHQRYKRERLSRALAAASLTGSQSTSLAILRQGSSGSTMSGLCANSGDRTSALSYLSVHK